MQWFLKLKKFAKKQLTFDKIDGKKKKENGYGFQDFRK